VERQREAQEARERLALIGDENEAPNREPPPVRRSAGDPGRSGMIFSFLFLAERTTDK